MGQCHVFRVKCLPDILYIRRTPIFYLKQTIWSRLTQIKKKNNLCDAIKIYGVKPCFPLKNVCQTYVIFDAHIFFISYDQFGQD